MKKIKLILRKIIIKNVSIINESGKTIKLTLQKTNTEYKIYS